MIQSAVSREKDYFEQQLALFRLASRRACEISKSIGNRFVSQRNGWAQWIHLRLCILSNSMLTLADFAARIDSGEECTLDQSSLAALARSMVEGSAMLSYIIDASLTEDQWELRKLVLWLHDATARYKMFSRWKNEDQAAFFREQVSILKAEIRSIAEFNSLTSDRQARIMSGGEMYVHGLRAAVRLMGLDVDDFEVAYNYLSCHAHSSPISFMRLEEHGVDFRIPTAAQRDIAGDALEIALGVLNIATDKILPIFA